MNLPKEATRTCPVCDKRRIEQTKTMICYRCQKTLRDQLAEILVYFAISEGRLNPSKGPSGSSSGNTTIGLNVDALSWFHNLGYSYLGGSWSGLHQMHSWERLIREERELTPPALIPYEGSTPAAVAAVVKFLTTHLDWIFEQVWAQDMAEEIAVIHNAGRQASRDYADKQRRIDCPADDEDGALCGSRLSVNTHDLEAIITCRRCGSRWTTARLMLVALSDSRTAWLDGEALGEYLGLEPRVIARFALKNHIPTKGRRPATYDVKAFLDARKGAMIA
jgi:hypothetical protein